MGLKIQTDQKAVSRRGRVPVRWYLLAVLILSIIILYALLSLRLTGNLFYQFRGIPGCLMLGLFYLSWTVYKNADRPLWYAILLGFLAVNLSCAAFMSEDTFNLMLQFSILISPVAVVPALSAVFRRYMQSRFLIGLLNMGIIFAVGLIMWNDYVFESIWLLTGALWSFVENKNCDVAERRSLRWKAWILTLSLLFFLTCFLQTEWKFVHYLCWDQAFMACLPVLCMLLLGRLSEKPWISKGYAALKLSVVYYVSVVTAGLVIWKVLYANSTDWHYSPEMMLYYLLMADLVFAVEMREFARKNDRKMGKGSIMAAIVVALFSNAAAVGILIMGNARIRSILDVRSMKGVGWITYRKAALESFLTGNLDPLNRLYGTHNREGYQDLVFGSGLGSMIYQQGFWVLLVLALLVVLAAVLLLSWKCEDRLIKRALNYLAISYLLRTAIVAVLLMFVVTSYHISLPFANLAMADAAVLLILHRVRNDKH